MLNCLLMWRAPKIPCRLARACQELSSLDANSTAPHARSRSKTILSVCTSASSCLSPKVFVLPVSVVPGVRSVELISATAAAMA